jgi:type III secretion system FlhB-like substrate exporter
VSPNNQGEVAKQIIETARKNGVKKLRIKIDKSAGVKVKANLKDANVGAVDIGSDGSMELSIEF